MMTSQLCITVVANLNAKKGWDPRIKNFKPGTVPATIGPWIPDKDNSPYMTIKSSGRQIPDNKELRRVSIKMVKHLAFNVSF